MSRKTLLLSCIVLFGLLVFALGVLSMWHIPLEPADKTPPTTIWSQTYGGIREEHAYSLIQTSDGGYALAGYTDSFGAGSSDFWSVKTESMYDETDENGAIPQFPSWIIATVAIIVIGGVALLVYFTKVKRTTGEAKKSAAVK